jgi:8-oxo-dGTP pyrophosphatase MutT (NUDIX family)
VGAWLNHCPPPGILECVASRIDEGEPAEEAVRREAKEETNCRVERMEFSGSYLATPGIIDERVDVYFDPLPARRK